MIEVAVPGWGELNLDYAVLDYNGTLAVDGILMPEVGDHFRSLAEALEIHVVTADTFGLASEQLGDLPCKLTVLPAGNQDQAKLDFVAALGRKGTVAIGNGRNDRKMLSAAALGIAVILDEGAAVETIQAADVLCPNIGSALDLLVNPLRLTATLRS